MKLRSTDVLCLRKDYAAVEVRDNEALSQRVERHEL
jgi:hypothetical protein